MVDIAYRCRRFNESHCPCKGLVHRFFHLLLLSRCAGKPCSIRFREGIHSVYMCLGHTDKDFEVARMLDKPRMFHLSKRFRFEDLDIKHPRKLYL